MEAVGHVEMEAKPKRTMHFIKLIKPNKELALIAQDVGKFHGRRAVTMWENHEEDLSQWSEQKGGALYELGNYYEKRVLNLKRILVELIETLDEPFIVNINY